MTIYLDSIGDLSDYFGPGKEVIEIPDVGLYI